MQSNFNFLTMVDYQKVIENIHAEVKQYFSMGKQASYIPALAEVNPRQYGIAVVTVDGEVFTVGDAEVPFSIQSISKVFALALTQRKMGDELWDSVGREPSGSPFNSLIQLENEFGKPRNPFINAGAMVVTDKLMSLYDDPNEELLNFVRLLSGSNRVNYDEEVAKSERETSYRNRALANFMKSFGNVQGDINRLIDIYCNQCSLSMNCVELAHSFIFLANRGVNPLTGTKILTPSKSKRLNALMLTCGLYDESGNFAYRVGMPGKSGVGGGIVAVIPGKLSIAVWSPKLNEHGNSVIGVETLERFTTDIGESIF